MGKNSEDEISGTCILSVSSVKYVVPNLILLQILKLKYIFMLTLARRNTQSYNGTIIYKHFFAIQNM